MTVKRPKHSAIKVSYEVVLDDDDDDDDDNNNNNNNKFKKCDKTAKNINITINYLTTSNSTFVDSDKLQIDNEEEMYIRRRGDAAGGKKINRKVVVVRMELAFQQFVLI